MSPSSFCGVEPATNLLVHGRDRGIKGLRDQGEDPDHSVPTCAGGWARTGALRPSAVRGASQGTAPCIASRTPRGFAGGALPVLRGRGAACCTPLAGDSSRVSVRGTGRRRRAPLQVDFAARRPLYRGGRSRGRSDRRRRRIQLSKTNRRAEERDPVGRWARGNERTAGRPTNRHGTSSVRGGRLSGAAAAASREPAAPDI